MTVFCFMVSQEWEVLLLSKLDWDMSAVIAFDFVEHIIQRVTILYGSGFNTDLVRRHSETLITMCSAHYLFSSISPCLIAAASVLTTLRPFLEASTSSSKTRDIPSPSSCSSISSIHPPDMEEVLEGVEKMTSIAKVNFYKIFCLEKLFLYYEQISYVTYFMS